MSDETKPARRIGLTASGLGCTYGDRVVLHQVDLAPEPGSVTLILGRNGAGKTTLMRRLCGLTPGTGQVLYGDRLLLDHRRPHEVLGVDLGNVQMHPGRTVADHLALVAHGVPGARARIRSLVATLEIEQYADRRPHALSTGTRRAVALIAALACDPAVLLLDEPMNGLEVERARVVRNLVKDHARRGGTVLLSSHILAGAELLADRLVLIEEGRVAASTTVEDFIDSRGGGGVEVVVDDPSTLARELSLLGLESSIHHDRLLVETEDIRAVASAARSSGVLVLALGRRRASLEDAVLGPVGPTDASVSGIEERA